MSDVMTQKIIQGVGEFMIKWAPPGEYGKKAFLGDLHALLVVAVEEATEYIVTPPPVAPRPPAP